MKIHIPGPIGGIEVARREHGLKRMTELLVPIRVAPKPRLEHFWLERIRRAVAHDRFLPVDELHGLFPLWIECDQANPPI